MIRSGGSYEENGGGIFIVRGKWTGREGFGKLREV